MNKIIKRKNIFLIFVFLHYLLSLCFNLNFIKIEEFDAKATIIFFIIELLFFISLLFAYRKIIDVMKKPEIIEKNKKYIKTFFIYFGILIVLLLLVWPGVWRWDEIWIALDAQKYVLDGWQNILSSFFFLFSFKFIASYVGVVIVQCIFISVIVSYVINKVYEFLKIGNEKFKVLLYIPFILLPVLNNNLYPIRSVWYSYLVLFYGVKLIDLYKKDKLSWNDSIVLAVLISLLSSLRNEGIYFLGIFLIICIYFLKKRRIKLKQFYISIIVPILLTFFLYMMNSLYMGSEKTSSYNMTSTTGSLMPLIYEANVNGDKELLDSINKIVDIKALSNYSKEDQGMIPWNRLIKYENLETNYEEYMKAFIKLNLKYPHIVISNKKNDMDEKYNTTFINLFNSSINYETKDELFEYYDNIDFVNLFLEFEKSSGAFSKPINKELRKNVISILEGRTIDNYHNKTILYKLWYLYPPLIISIFFFCYLMIKKKWFYSFVYFSMLFKFILVFFTQPSFLFMYYFSDYLIGYISLMILILKLLKKIKVIHKC